jgi:hypothetical protein
MRWVHEGDGKGSGPTACSIPECYRFSEEHDEDGKQMPY